ncbi:MAG: choice-of-anchor Q domain-containing protein, partial [Chthoniobacterales bacterium]
MLINCTFNGNAATGGRGGDGYSGSPAGVGGAADGGGVWNSGSATLINTTLAANSVLRGNGGGGAGLSPGGNGGNVTGGGFAQAGAANCVSRNTIVAGDSATGGTGGIATPGSGASSGANGTATGTDIYGAISSQGRNLIGRTDGNSGWMASDLLGGTTAGTKLDPLLGALQDNSGPTQTLRPAAGSAAIDNGDDAVLSAPFSLTSDQRMSTSARWRSAFFNPDPLSPSRIRLGMMMEPAPPTTARFSKHSTRVTRTADANTIIFAPALSGIIST